MLRTLLPTNALHRQFFSFFCVGCLIISSPVFADGEGQADLDEATVLKLRAKSLNDLEKTADLCKSAIEKGLDDESKEYATMLLTSTLFERATRMSQLVFRVPRDPRWSALRRLALKDLQEALKYDETLGRVHLLTARLNDLERGDKDAAKKSIERALELIKDDNIDLSIAYLIRGNLTDNEEERFANYNKAIELDERNQAAWRARAIMHLFKGNTDAALEDFFKLLELTPHDVGAHQALAQIFRQQKEYDKALKHLDQAIDQGAQSPVIYILKSDIQESVDDKKGAAQTLVEATNNYPNNVDIWVQLGRLRIESGDFDLALDNLNTALRIQPDYSQAHLLRSILFAQRDRFDDAIRDINRVIRTIPNAPENKGRLNQLRMQLGSYQVFASRPRRAISVFTEVLQDDPENWEAYRSRGDAFLSIGRHSEAISDYEAALQLAPEAEGVLNNLAWVLATSPKDEIRNADRSIELATKACEVTKYEAAHIISTLAAGYAEKGDFETAIDWSTKAVELDAKEVQLAKELESYKQKKPWRELQEIEESPDVDEPTTDDLNSIFEPDESP